MLHAGQELVATAAARDCRHHFRHPGFRLAGIDPGHAGAAVRRLRARGWRDFADRRLHRQRQAGADLVAGRGWLARDRRGHRHLRVAWHHGDPAGGVHRRLGIGDGIFEIIGAIQLRKEIDNEWMLILGGLLSVVFGLIVLFAPGAGALGLIWAIASYSIVFGILFIALALRLRKYGHAGGPAAAA